MNKLFYQIYHFIYNNKIWSVFGLAALVGILLFFATSIQFEEDISKLIPSDSKSKEIQKVLKSVNFSDKIIVNIRKQPQGQVSDLTQYASQFIDSIERQAEGFVKRIQGKVADDDIDSSLNFLYENAPLFLNEADYEMIQNKLHKDSIASITEANYKTLLSPTGIVAKRSILRDPLGISFMALKKLDQLGVGDQFTLKDGFLLSKDEQNVLLFLTPDFPSSETAKNEIFASILYNIRDELNRTFYDKVSSEYYGGALIAVANAQQIKRDIQFTVGIALTVLILIFIVFYRKLTIPLILFTPTAFGGLLAVAILYLIRTEISAISLGIGSVLVGVTLDYSLHILTHIRNNKDITYLYHHITKPILMSSLTTGLAFLCLLFIDSQALQDLGIFAAISVFGASVFALLFIPQVYKGGRNLTAKETKRDRSLTILDRLASYNFHENRIFIAAIGLLVVVSAFTYNGVIFDKDISKLNYEPPAIKKAIQNLDTLTHIGSKSIYLAVYGNTTEDALRKNDLIYAELRSLENQGEIVSFSSIGGLIQSEAEQMKQIRQWQHFWNPETIRSTKEKLIESGSTFGFKPTTFDNFYSLLESDFKPLPPSEYSSISAASINDFITETDGFTTVTSLVKVDEENLGKVKSVFKDTEQTLVIDRKEMNETLLGHLKNDFNSLIVYSLIVVLLILTLFFRSLSLTLVTAVPIFLTWIVTIGLMGLLGIEFNIFNIIVSTFIFGLGIDYGIFITTGLLKQNQTGERTIITHKTSIILSVITTILGVGVLVFAKHPALYSISVVSIIGIFSAMFISFTIQPLLFKLFIGSRTKRPISLRLLLHSTTSFAYYGLGGLSLSFFSITIMKILPFRKKVKMRGFHWTISKFMKSVLYTNPFVKKQIINKEKESFQKPGIIIANHTSFLDILSIGMLHPNIIFLVNDWVYNSPIFGKAVQLAGFYPVSGGIENGVEILRSKVEQGYSLMAFPEGTRSTTNQIRRFHKGAFFLAEKLDLDIIPVLIHGNSEINPKGSFIIRDGRLTIKILKRILANDLSFGNSYKERAKRIGVYFRNEFDSLRDEIEDANYFHKVVKLDYRYKGDQLFNKVKKDLMENEYNYKEVLETVGKESKIIDISSGYGQLDFLLLLDHAKRRICTYIENESVRSIVKNSFITAHYNRITFASSKEEALAHASDVVIMDASERNNFEAQNRVNNKFSDFQIAFQNHKLVIFKQKGDT